MAQARITRSLVSDPPHRRGPTGDIMACSSSSWSRRTFYPRGGHGRQGNGVEMKKQKRVPTLRQSRGPTAADVIDRVLDKGIVIEWRVTRVWLSGIDLPVGVNARYVVASLDTYRQYADPHRKAGFPSVSDAWLHELTTP